ncbi:hypothetical protein [Neolewinella persica]|uniref:hypothetical protein n=1 Tax=Neolewinella persica TaxID=70998 RepID=UPI0003613B9E|nr:hypothetical protein [Neolewinella persica]
MKFNKTNTERLTNLFLQEQFPVLKQEISKVIEISVLHDTAQDHHYVRFICYTLLGLTAFEEKLYGDSCEYLTKSAIAKKSPVIASFGPNMLLAHQLSHKGYTKEVAEFLVHFEDISASSHFATFTPSAWISSLKSGKKPDFAQHVFMHLAPNKGLIESLKHYLKST